jgi:hypothetical protein
MQKKIDATLPVEICNRSACSVPAANARLQLQWHDMRGGLRQMPARALNGSRFGALLQVERPIPTGTVVVVYSTQGVVVGRGSIRHCTPKGMDYLVGLYLPNRLARAF